MSLRFSMYGTSPSKNVRRSAASNVAVAPAAADVADSGGGADVAGGAVDVAGAGCVAIADGTCARHGAHTLRISSSGARRFNMSCLLKRKGMERNDVAPRIETWNRGSEIPADRNAEQAGRDDRRVVFHHPGDRIELSRDRHVILEGACLHDAALVGQVLDVDVDVPLVTVHARAQVDGVVAGNGRTRRQRRQNARDRIAEGEVGRALADILIAGAHVAVPAATQREV